MIQEIMTRRSVRRYTDEAVTREQLTDLLRAAMNAPSAKNTQEWRFLVVTDRETLNKINEIHPFAQMMLQAQAAVIVSADLPEAYNEGYAYLDCGAAIQNLLLEAVHEGLGACWCGIAPQEERITAFRAAFRLPDHYLPMGVVAIGHPAPMKPRQDQFDPEKITWWEG